MDEWIGTLSSGVVGVPGVVGACIVPGDGVGVTVAPVVTHGGGFLLLLHPDQQVNNGTNHTEHGHQHEQYSHLADVFGQIVHVVGHLEHLRQFSQHLVEADRVRCQVGHIFEWMLKSWLLTWTLTSGERKAVRKRSNHADRSTRTTRITTDG
ncbi:conserved hypothetical protein [Trichinella spiralis]|uniref:hypothetical protein n=1 Tax=Trichinella spiralis TaxID=6334 RepID=UPI0001EFB292|nr:conserved hypothetical protein [Trichinella spiralis]